ncbi:OsmC family protein [Corynebacterium sp.]|uniref:OsmC family protein n=1 Tax=Corynebacterium sp. TaxID=1720 RepID=UPI0037361371
MSDLTPNHNAGEPLEPIDKDKLAELAQKNIDNPEGGWKKIRTHTEADGKFRNYTKVRKLDPVLVSEPPALLGDDTAPNPTEIAQAGLAACISVGIQAIATHRGVTLTKIDIDIESDIDISPTWGTGDISVDKRPGVSDVRVEIDVDGDTDRETLQKIVDDAITWSPVVNTYTRPANLTHKLV